MFSKTPAQPVAPVPNGAPATPSDVVIHVMPREFYGKEATVTEIVSTKVAEAAPTPLPAPIAPIAPPVAHMPQKKSHSWVGVIIVTLVFLTILGVGGYFAYTRVTEAQEREQLAAEQAREAEDARGKLEAERLRQQQLQQEQQAAAALIPTAGKDTDSDGLSDIEELLYGTDQRDPDSDKDTFLDGNEVFHRYHPLGSAPATLLDTGAVRELEEATYPYTLYYPSTWSVALNRDLFGVTFKSARQASISLKWEEKEADESLARWLNDKEIGVEVAALKETMTKLGYYGLVSEDDRTAYLDLGEAVLVMTYDLGEKNQIEYLQTFQMMVNSLELLEPTP